MPTPSTPTVTWPDGRRFAFTVFDDTDNMTLDVGSIVYGFLAEIGMLTTKTVWPIESAEPPQIGGTSCADPDYRSWVLDLQEQGFEIGLHGVAAGTADREQTVAGLDRFHQIFGHDPHTHANHSGCDNCIYWGEKRLTGAARLAYNVMTRFRNRGWQGEVEGSPLFWGDVCRSRIEYVRNFVYGDINTLAACPDMPYHDPRRPYVREWFASSEGSAVDAFVDMISEDNQDRLEQEGGACIMYTHFASGFVVDGQLDPRFRHLMTRLAAKDGWFVPTTTLLDHIRTQRGGQHVISDRRRRALERRWLRHKMSVGAS
ncbi:MAG: hypothetical protein HKN44_00390 [Ilumatobacter sp.]|nr:hypothetical protein [Ilumatobacter sp.]